jgi:3-isopropylmalate dehydratase
MLIAVVVCLVSTQAFRMGSKSTGVMNKFVSSTSISMSGQTMFDKIWESHLVDATEGQSLIYVDRHLVHEVTSPQAFEGLRTAGRSVRRPDCTLSTVDHNVPTSDRSSFKDVESFVTESDSRTQVLARECKRVWFDIFCIR